MLQRPFKEPYKIDGRWKEVRTKANDGYDQRLL